MVAREKTLVYGFDPLCGWCFGFIPALEWLTRDRPDVAVDLRLGGLVTGGRIRPYAESAGYIAEASARMANVTGQRPAAAFFGRITGSTTIIASSIPPSAAVRQVRATHPQATLAFAHRLQQAHFRDGDDLNDPATYPPILAALGLDMTIDLPGPRDLPADLIAEFDATRASGITSYPTIAVQTAAHLRILPTIYDPGEFVAQIAAQLPRAASA